MTGFPAEEVIELFTRIFREEYKYRVVPFPLDVKAPLRVISLLAASVFNVVLPLIEPALIVKLCVE